MDKTMFEGVFDDYGSVKEREMIITCKCVQAPNRNVQLQISNMNTKKELYETVMAELGLDLDALAKKAGRSSYPLLINARNESSPADDEPIGDFIRDGEEVYVTGFGDVA